MLWYFSQLCFKRGDVITVTQKEEGGWWEGTLDEKTGWFPSNYVKEYKPPGNCEIDNNLFLSLYSRCFLHKSLL